MKTKTNPLTFIRSTAIGRANRLQSLHSHLATLRPAFHAWNNGEVFVGGRGAYRFREGRELAPWSDLVRSLFPTVADFAFAAVILAGCQPVAVSTAPATPKQAGRANIISLAKAA